MVRFRASNTFSESGKQEVLNALIQAEEKTTGEIVPVVASVSGRYDRAEDIFAFLTALVIFFLVWFFAGKASPEQSWEAAGRPLAWGYMLLAMIAGFVIGSASASRFPVLRLPFVMKREMHDEVERAAESCFYRFGVGGTRAATGILIYISLFERMVVVKGDTAINEKLSKSDWQEVCDAVLRGMKEGDPAGGLRRAVAKSGELLTLHFPAGERDVNKNELRNEIYCLDEWR